MGLIKAATSAISSGFGDQFKEFVSCPTIDNDVIIQRGEVSHGDGNKNPSDGVISNGSGIAVPEGMAMMIVDNGKIVEFSAEPGTFTWDSSSEPSIFYGPLGKNIIDSIKTIGQRITFGGQTARDQRVYYINIKNIMGNTFGSSQPETVYDPVYGSVEITYNGEYAIKVVDPVVLVNNVVGANPKDTLTYDDIFKNDAGGMNQLKSKFSQKVSEAISTIMTMHNVSFNKIQMYKSDVTEQMGKILNDDWTKNYGITVVDVALRVNASEESRKIVQEMDRKVAETTRMGKVYSENLVGTMAAASGEAMKDAANNEAGAMMGFMGMGMAQGQGNNMLGAVANMGSSNTDTTQPAGEMPKPGSLFGGVESESTVAKEESTNEAPASTDLAFCPDCGAKRIGKFCTQCGRKLGE